MQILQQEIRSLCLFVRDSGYENPWQIEECVELNMATKLMTMYISQSDKETENEKKLRKIIDYDRKTSCYTIAKFYEQIGRLRKFAEEKRRTGCSVTYRFFRNA